MSSWWAETADEEAWKGVETETGLAAAAWRCRYTESDARCALCCWLPAQRVSTTCATTHVCGKIPERCDEWKSWKVDALK